MQPIENSYNREKMSCMVITYNVIMTPAARRRNVRVKYFCEFLKEPAQKIFVSLYYPSITRGNESKAL